MDRITAMKLAETPSGEIVTLYELQNFTDVGTECQPSKHPPGIKRMELADGRALTIGRAWPIQSRRNR